MKHVVLALAAMHSGMLDRQDEHASRQHMLYAKEQYTVALGEARQLVASAASTQIHRLLIMCLLFIAWEGVRGDYLASQRHMDSGRALAARFHHQIRQKASLASIVHEIMLVLARMDISAIAFSDYLLSAIPVAGPAIGGIRPGTGHGRFHKHARCKCLPHGDYTVFTAVGK